MRRRAHALEAAVGEEARRLGDLGSMLRSLENLGGRLLTFGQESASSGSEDDNDDDIEVEAVAQSPGYRRRCPGSGSKRKRKKMPGPTRRRRRKNRSLPEGSRTRRTPWRNL